MMALLTTCAQMSWPSLPSKRANIINRFVPSHMISYSFNSSFLPLKHVPNPHFPGFAGPKNANKTLNSGVSKCENLLLCLTLGKTEMNYDELRSIDVWMVEAKHNQNKQHTHVHTSSPFPFSFLLYPFSKIWIISQIYSNIYLRTIVNMFSPTSSPIELLTACNVPSVSHHQLKVVITYSLVMVSKVNLRSMAKPRAASQTSKRLLLLLLKLLSMEALTHS